MRRARRRHEDREARRRALLSRGQGAALAAGAGIGATVLFAPAAEAATFTVSNLDDAGTGSLRQAVLDANLTTAADDVVFQAGLTGTITLTSGELVITEPLDIQGPGAATITVDGDDASRIFYINPNTDDSVFSITGLTMHDGNAAGSSGGALYTHDSVLTVADDVFTSNVAGSSGGALYARETTLTIENSTFTGNEANEGGAVYTDGDSTLDAPANNVVIRGSTFTGNNATDNGGAIYIDDNTDGGLLIEGSTIAGNHADADSGGLKIYGPDDDATGDVVVRETTISGNVADEEGGGVYVLQPGNPVAFRNVTISGNQALTGGGVYIDNDYDVPVSFENSTVADNIATGPLGGGGIYRLAADDEPSTDLVRLSSTIVANNTGGDLANGPTPEGTFELGFSLVRDPAAAVTSESPAGSNLLGVDPLLGPLADNGGPTQTHLPAIGSPALDAGIANGLTTDQRGEARTFDASNIANGAGSDATDIGAVELAAAGTCKGKAATVLFVPGQKIVGSSAKDVVVGTDAKDKVSAKGGKDTVCAGKGNDSVKGGGGKDKLFGEKGKDTLSGQAGKDKLAGAAGNDTLKGGGGKDNLKGGPGKDKLRGGPGKDKLSGGGGKDSEVQ